MLAGLGEIWLTDTLAIKKYPGCAYVDSSLDALFSVLDDCTQSFGRRPTPDEIAKIEVDSGRLTVEMNSLALDAADPSRLRPAEINFSIPLSLACAVVAGRMTGAEMLPEFLASHERVIRSVAKRVVLRHDWPMTLATVDAFAWSPDGRSIVDSLSLADLSRVAAGYQRQLGGGRRRSFALGSVAGLSGRRVLTDALGTVGRRLRIKRPRMLPDPAAYFRDFRVVFPARVTMMTCGAETFTAQQDIPLGAPGQNDLPAVAREKFLTEFTADWSAQKAAAAFEAVIHADENSAASIVAAVSDTR
jgi:hypothetical protein